jgi:hypothetical protein
MSPFPAFVVWRLSLTRGATATTKRSAASLLEELSVYITWDFAEKPALAGLQMEEHRICGWGRARKVPRVCGHKAIGIIGRASKVRASAVTDGDAFGKFEGIIDSD